jgi:hypothetical protein
VVGKPLPYVPFPPSRQIFPLNGRHHSSNAIDANTEMLSVLAISPKWHVIPRYSVLVRVRLINMYSDFLIRLSVKRLPSPHTGSNKPMYTLVPDGVQHPKFKGLDSRKGYYVVCRRAAIQELDKRGIAFYLLISRF